MRGVDNLSQRMNKKGIKFFQIVPSGMAFQPERYVVPGIIPKDDTLPNAIEIGGNMKAKICYNGN